jgi:hypothetical protein
MVVMMMAGGKSRASKDHQQQGDCNNLLHGMNVARKTAAEFHMKAAESTLAPLCKDRAASSALAPFPVD